MNFSNIPKLDILWTDLPPTSERHEWKSKPLFFEKKFANQYVVLLNHEVSRFLIGAYNGRNYQCEEWEDDAGNKSEYRHFLKGFLDGQLVHLKEENGGSSVIAFYDIKEWFGYWRDKNLFKKLSHLHHKIGFTRAEALTMMKDRTCSLHHLTSCACGIPECYASFGLLMHGEVGDYSIPFIVETSSGISYAAVTADLNVHHKEWFESDETTNSEPMILEMEENDGLRLAPENYFTI